jgi:hypothetical protein
VTLKARFRDGRRIVEEPTDLPQGGEDDRAALHDALLQSQADVDAGHLVSAEGILRELRPRTRAAPTLEAITERR